MITPVEILDHMYRVLPQVTGRLYKKITSHSGKVMKVGDDFLLSVTVDDVSGFSVGRSYNVQDIDLINPVIACSGSSSQGWTLETENNHRITEPKLKNDSKTFIVNGNWDGEQKIYSIPNRKTVFVRNGESGAFTGSIIERLSGESGYMKCVSIDGQQITFKFNDGYVYPCDCNVGFISSRLNIAIVTDIERAKQIYAQRQDDDHSLFAFLIMGDRNTIADKDAVAGQYAKAQTGKTYLDITTAFNILVFWPRQKNQEAGRFQLQEAYGDIQNVFNRVFFGHRFNRESGFKIMPAGAGIADVSDVANFGFVYEYQAIDRIETENDGIRSEYLYYDVPIRDINPGDMTMYVSDGNDKQPIFINANLDRNPI